MGQFAAGIASYIVNNSTNQHKAYLRLIYSEWIFSGIVFLSLLILPESPSKSEASHAASIPDKSTLSGWYIRKGKLEKAEAVLQRMNGKIQGSSSTNLLS
jgi:hypothetical protein